MAVELPEALLLLLLLVKLINSQRSNNQNFQCCFIISLSRTSPYRFQLSFYVLLPHLTDFLNTKRSQVSSQSVFKRFFLFVLFSLQLAIHLTRFVACKLSFLYKPSNSLKVDIEIRTARSLPQRLSSEGNSTFSITSQHGTWKPVGIDSSGRIGY